MKSVFMKDSLLNLTSLTRTDGATVSLLLRPLECELMKSPALEQAAGKDFGDGGYHSN